MFRKIKTAVFLLTLSVSPSSYSFDLKSICNDVEKINAIMVPYKPQAWPGMAVTPTGPVPTVTYFALNSREVILDACSFFIRLQSLTTEGKIYAVAGAFNKMTNNQFNEEINLLSTYHDLGAGLATLGRGGNKLDNVMIHRKINNALGETQDYIGGDEPTFEEKWKRENKVSSMVKSASRLTTYKDFGKCQTGRPDDPEALKFYMSEIVPLNELLQEQNEEYEYSLNQLRRMGIKFNVSYEEHKKYQVELIDAVSKGVFFRRSDPKVMKVPTYNGGKKGEERMVDQVYYTYSVAEAPHHFNNLKKHETAWNNYALSQIGAKGIFNNIRNNAESDIRDLSFECRRPHIEWKVRRGNPEFATMDKHDSIFASKIQKNIDECLRGSKITSEGVKTLYGRYINHMKIALLSRGRIQAKIWDYESRYKGNHINVSTSSVSSEIGDIAQERIECERAPNAGELQYARSLVRDIKVETTGLRLEEEMQKTTLLEARVREKKEREENEARRAEIIKEMELRQTYINDELKKPDINDINF